MSRFRTIFFWRLLLTAFGCLLASACAGPLVNAGDDGTSDPRFSEGSGSAGATTDESSDTSEDGEGAGTVEDGDAADPLSFDAADGGEDDLGATGNADGEADDVSGAVPAAEAGATPTTVEPTEEPVDDSDSSTSPTTTADSAESPTTAPAAEPAPAAVADGEGFLPPGSTLPTGDECRALVQPAAAVRANNSGPNSTTGGPTLTGDQFGRVTGDMTGTTDEIIQWAACKWGLPADVVRAQAATETWWRQGFLGDWTTNAADCAPGHSLGSGDRPGECPQSIGILQIKYKFFKEAFPAASESTAYSLDYAYAVWRNCYEGHQVWLNDSERGREYEAGDGWGCIGRWFAGSWYTDPATNYISEVKERLNGKVWTTEDFISHG